MTKPRPRAVSSLDSQSSSFSSTIMEHLQRWMLLFVVCVNTVICLFVVSFCTLYRSSCGLMSLDGVHLLVKNSHSSLVATLALKHANASAKVDQVLTSVLQLFYVVDTADQSLSIAGLVLGNEWLRCGLDHTEGTAAVPSDSVDMKETTSSKGETSHRKRKSVTFNEHVEVRLIANTSFGEYQPGYFANRYSLVNNFTLIPANTFVQYC
ncbi:uncharacterized protein BXIN_2862 [Babesia sp. Xinjiang]|uniref:uncharacterized protein n=1 Tax=Babesia sp. Xinjiang TaxID=462227 RepID=UPI000A241AA4|nr:uncharacterized protein BXIN_2862 [Babesia sp. Xinjiang]ORM39347.1 hypothetical protein BXIN_2862 [Babesia sp. Xinjiang]